MNSSVIVYQVKLICTAVKVEFKDMLQQHPEHYFVAGDKTVIRNDYLIYYSEYHID